MLTDQRPLELRLSCVNSWPVAQKAVHTASDAQVLPKSNNNKKREEQGEGARDRWPDRVAPDVSSPSDPPALSCGPSLSSPPIEGSLLRLAVYSSFCASIATGNHSSQFRAAP